MTDPDDEIIRELELAGVCCFPEIDQPNFAAFPLEAAEGELESE